MLILVAATGCLPSFEQDLDQRELEMRDHEIDAFDALTALGDRDLAALREAGQKLAKQDDVPGLPAHAVPLLKATRLEGQALAKAKTLTDTAVPLSRLAGHCGACHAMLEVEPAAPARELPLEEAFFAVAFQEDARWVRATNALGIESPSGWDARRSFLESALKTYAAAGAEPGEE